MARRARERPRGPAPPGGRINEPNDDRPIDRPISAPDDHTCRVGRDVHLAPRAGVRLGAARRHADALPPGSRPPANFRRMTRAPRSRRPRQSTPGRHGPSCGTDPPRIGVWGWDRVSTLTAAGCCASRHCLGGQQLGKSTAPRGRPVTAGRPNCDVTPAWRGPYRSGVGGPGHPPAPRSSIEKFHGKN
jgi:hypothetical protein